MLKLTFIPKMFFNFAFAFDCFILGLIYENRLCVNPTECPCDYHGTVHRTGSVIHEECNNWFVIFLKIVPFILYAFHVIVQNM